MSTETKKPKALWAARLKKRHARGRRPEKTNTLREKRDPRVLKAYREAAADILDALFGRDGGKQP